MNRLIILNIFAILLIKFNNNKDYMTKAELVSLIAQKTGVEKSTVMTIFETTMEEIKFAIKDNESVFLRGFGTFKAKKRAEKTGRNIKKNIAVKIPAHYTPSFKPSKSFVKEVKNNVK